MSVWQLWRRDGAGRPRRHQRVRVEYPVGEETRLISGELRMGATPVRAGDHVTVRLRPGRPPVVAPVTPEQPVAARQVRSGLLVYAGLIAVVLLVGGGVWLSVTSNPDRYLPTGPPASSAAESDGDRRGSGSRNGVAPSGVTPSGPAVTPSGPAVTPSGPVVSGSPGG